MKYKNSESNSKSNSKFTGVKDMEAEEIYILDEDDQEDSFFDDAKEPREYFEEEKEPKEEDPYDDFEMMDDEFDDFKGEDFESDEQQDNETLFENTSKGDMQTFVLYWVMVDETRAAFLAAKYGLDPKDLLFYPDIAKDGENETIKKAGAIVVRKYSDLIFFSHAPEMILLASIIASSLMIFFRAKTKAKENEGRAKSDNKTTTKTATTETKNKEEKESKRQPFDFVKTA